jgi:cyclophilin family peptidyl-prolyl cis-trans isomerase
MNKILVFVFLFLGFVSCSSKQDQKLGASQVIIKTTLGDIHIELFEKQAPITVANFLAYAEQRHYNHTIFHRVIDGFMIQGGGFTADMTQKPTNPAIKNEANNGLSNKRGTLAMARTSKVDSATAQFFINVADNDFLNYTPANYGYCVFGRVTQGMDVVDKIKSVSTTTVKGYPNVPATPVEIIEIVKNP